MKQGFIAACLLAIATGCDPFQLKGDVKLPISELQVADSIAPNDRLTMTVVVVTGGCREFDRVVSRRQAAVLIVEAWGSDSDGINGVACTDDIRYEPHTHSVDGPHPNPLIISAVLPDGSSITRTVKVK